MEQLEHCVVAWLGAGRKCFVKALTPKSRIFGELRHATGAGHVTYSGQKYIGIGIFQCGGYVFRDGFFIIEVIGSIERGEFSQGDSLSKARAISMWAFDITLLR